MAGLYFHIPFCRQRCVYCDFYFVTTQKSHAPFIAALQREVAHYAHEFAEREAIHTIYFGGGTPSQLLLEEWFAVLDTVHQHFDTDEVKEVTAEVNPGDVNLEYLRELRRLGVNRLSIGIQSFFDADLQALNRSHSALQATEIIHLARTAGFDNFSIDLIFGIPDQPFEYWGANLERAARLGVPHISTYGLTIEDGTPLHREVRQGLITPTPEDDVRELYDFTMGYLTERGYRHYEISSFALEGRESIHNRAYWNHSNYIGLGPSAHSFWWTGLPAARWSNIRNLPRYEALLQQGRAPVEDRESLSLDRLANEYIMLQIRTSEGVDMDVLSSRYGADLSFERAAELEDLLQHDHIEIESGTIRLTTAGKHLADAVTARLLLDD